MPCPGLFVPQKQMNPYSNLPISQNRANSRSVVQLESKTESDSKAVLLEDFSVKSQGQVPNSRVSTEGGEVLQARPCQGARRLPWSNRRGTCKEGTWLARKGAGQKVPKTLMHPVPSRGLLILEVPEIRCMPWRRLQASLPQGPPAAPREPECPGL